MSEAITIQLTHVKKQLGSTLALSDVSLTFEAGLMHGIIGPEGAGKTTLMRVILGLLKPNEGNVEFFQKDKEASLKFKEVRAKISYMPQQASLYPDLSIEEHLSFFKALYQISAEDYQKRRETLLDITNLGPFVNRRVGELSGGMYKKVGLMCALLRSPEILLLDEPTNGVDPISRREFWDLLYQLLNDKVLILVTTSYMDEAERCSIVHLLESGKVVGEGEPTYLLKKESVQNFDELFLKWSQPSR